MRRDLTPSLASPARRLLIAVSALVSVFIVPCAHAQTGQEVAVAEALFRRGLDDMKAGRFASACPALDQSYRLDARPGALFTLAECNAKWGKIATAVTEYDDFIQAIARLPVERRGNYQNRVNDAQVQRSSLVTAVPKLTVTVAGGLPRDAIVTCDGVALGSGALDVPLPLDPGDHEVTVRTQGGTPFVRHLRLERGDAQRLELPAPPPPVAPPPVATAAPGLPPTPPSHDESAARTSSRHTWGYAVGGAGVAALAVGGVAGVLALTGKHDVDTQCPSHVCQPGGSSVVDRTKTEAIVSDIGLGVGIVGVAVGAYLLFGPSSRPEPASTSALRATFAPTVGGALAGVSASFLIAPKRRAAPPRGHHPRRRARDTVSPKHDGSGAPAAW